MTESDKSAEPNFSIQRLYVKNISLEAPNSPEMFLTDWQPSVEMDLAIDSQPLEDHVHEVKLRVTVQVKNNDKHAFLVEVDQAGIFYLEHFRDDDIEMMLASYCPTILFPYAREVVSDLVIRAGFPPLYLSPVNFDAMYLEQQQKQAEQAEMQH